jgi:hypothetical protein
MLADDSFFGSQLLSIVEKFVEFIDIILVIFLHNSCLISFQNTSRDQNVIINFASHCVRGLIAISEVLLQ